jgi:hypothetical protein
LPDLVGIAASAVPVEEAASRVYMELAVASFSCGLQVSWCLSVGVKV